MKSALLAGLSGTLLLSTPLIVTAQDDESFAIVVTASRSAETLDDALVPVTVITREQIERSHATTLPELLSSIPGVVVTRNGGVGQNTSVFLRGTESDHVLVLIDGVKVGSATSGTMPFQHIPLIQVEKIEVVRGARSSLYGSEALGGVIQIFTRRSVQTPQPSLDLSAGSHHTNAVSAGMTDSSESAWYSLMASAFSTEGFDVRRDEEPDEDGYDNTSLSLRAGAGVTEQLTVDASWLETRGEVEFDGRFQNRSDSHTRVFRLSGDYTVTDDWTTRVLIGQSKDDTENYLDQTFSSHFETHRDHLTWTNEMAVGAIDLTLGVDHLQDQVTSTTAYEVSERDQTGLFSVMRVGLGAADLELSVREDDIELFGRQTTGGIAMGWDFGHGMRTTLSWSEAFKAPSFNELYFPGFGNPDLEAETAQGVDIGWLKTEERYFWSLNLFHTQIDHLIASAQTATGDFRATNINAVEIDGLELTGGIQHDQWKISGTLTLQDPRDTDSGELLNRRAKRILNLRIGRDFGRWSLAASVLHRGDTRDGSAAMDGFTVWNVRTDFKLGRHWSLGAQFNNLLDEKYETARDYPQDGFNVIATLRYRKN